MAKAKKSKKTQTESPRDAWVSRGVDSVYFQRETQVAWWTILGGIAVAALLTEVDSVIMAVKDQRWLGTVEPDNKDPFQPIPLATYFFVCSPCISTLDTSGRVISSGSISPRSSISRTWVPLK